MRPIKNRSNDAVCGCSILPRLYYKNGKKRKKVDRDRDLLEKWQDNLYSHCTVDKEGNCKERGENGHSIIGKYYYRSKYNKTVFCRYCYTERVEFIPHKNIERHLSSSNRNGRVRHFPIPNLYCPTPEEITDMNEDYNEDY